MSNPASFVEQEAEAIRRRWWECTKQTFQNQIAAVAPASRDYQRAVVAEMDKRGGRWSDNITETLRPLSEAREKAWRAAYAVGYAAREAVDAEYDKCMAEMLCCGLA